MSLADHARATPEADDSSIEGAGSSASLSDSLCILSPIKLRESTFLKLGQAATKRFRLIEDEVDTVYVAQLSVHVSGSDEVIQCARLSPSVSDVYNG